MSEGPAELPSRSAPRHLARRRRHSGGLRIVDSLTFGTAAGGTAVLIGALVLAGVTIIIGAWPAIVQFGWRFLVTSSWNPVELPNKAVTFGAWPFIYTTLVTSLVALVISFPVSVGAAIFLVKLAPKVRIPVPARLIGRRSPTGWIFMNPRHLVTVTSFLIELLAAIPSIAYGLWGVAVLVPFMQEHVQPVMGKTLGAVPGIGVFFADPASGSNIFTASVVLAIMVTPIMTAIIRDVLAVVPPELEQGALGLGATWWQAMKLVLGFARMGIFGAVVLGFARAMGETMAVTMIIGNSRSAGFSLFSPGETIASKLANQFIGVDTDAERYALYYTALILLLITMFINGFARVVLLRVSTERKK